MAFLSTAQLTRPPWQLASCSVFQGMGTASEHPAHSLCPAVLPGTSLAIPLYGNEGFLYFVPQFLSQASAPPVLLLFMCGCMSHFITHWLHPMLTGRAWARATINISFHSHVSRASRASLCQSGLCFSSDSCQCAFIPNFISHVTRSPSWHQLETSKNTLMWYFKGTLLASLGAGW